MNNPLTRIFAALALASATASVHAADLWDVYQRAQEADPQIMAAEAAHQAAVEARPLARSALFPKLNFSAGTSHTESKINDSFTPSQVGTTQSYDSSNYSLNLSQPIYHHDYYIQLRQADGRVVQADAELAAARQGLMVRAAQAYFNVLAARDSLRFAQAEKKAVEQQLRQTRQRFEVGLTAVTDVREAQARYDLTVAQEIAAQNQLDNSNEQLRVLTGMDYERLAILGEVPLVVPEPTDINKWVDTALEQNLQLLATEAGTRVAGEEVARRRAQRYPTLDLNASYGHSEQPAFSRDTDDTTIGVQLNFPFYQGGAISANTRQAAALFNQAQALLEQQRRTTVSQTRSAYLGVQAGISQVKALRQALASAQTALEATQAGFEVGTRTAVDVLNSQRELYRAERDYASARYTYVLSTLQLKQASGTLQPTDLRQVNAWLENAR